MKSKNKLAIAIVVSVVLFVCMVGVVAFVNASNDRNLSTGPLVMPDGYSTANGLMMVAGAKFLVIGWLVSLPLAVIFQRRSSLKLRLKAWFGCLFLLIGPAVIYSAFALAVAVNWQLDAVVDFDMTKTLDAYSSPVSARVPVFHGFLWGGIFSVFSIITLKHAFATRPLKSGFRNNINIHSK